MAPRRMETIDDKNRCGGKAAALGGVLNIRFWRGFSGDWYNPSKNRRNTVNKTTLPPHNPPHYLFCQQKPPAAQGKSRHKRRTSQQENILCIATLSKRS